MQGPWCATTRDLRGSASGELTLLLLLRGGCLLGGGGLGLGGCLVLGHFVTVLSYIIILCGRRDMRRGGETLGFITALPLARFSGVIRRSQRCGSRGGAGPGRAASRVRRTSLLVEKMKLCSVSKTDTHKSLKWKLHDSFHCSFIPTFN